MAPFSFSQNLFYDKLLLIGGGTMQIGEQIRQLRKKQGLTQISLAERLYVTPQAVSQWERGITIPDTDKLVDIAAVLHTTVSKLTGGETTGQDWIIADSLFSPDHMYSRIAVTAELKGLRETSSALRFMKKQHEGQYGKPSLFSDVKSALYRSSADDGLPCSCLGHPGG